MMSDQPMTCDAVATAMPAYLANTIDERVAEAIELHVSTCASCEAQLERATRIDLDTFAPAVPAALRARVVAALPVTTSTPRRSWWGPASALAALAAAAVLFVSTTRGTGPDEPDPKTTVATIPMAPPVATPPVDHTVGAVVSARALATEQAASEFQSLDAAARELEQAIKAAPADRDMRAYLDAVHARRAELAEKIAEAAS